MNSKIGAKDLITLGIFTVIYFVIGAALSLLVSIPIMVPFFPAVWALINGTVFMLYTTKVTPCVIAAFFLMTTTSVSEFIGSMKKMHITDKITIPLSVVFRFFPTVKEDARAINDAMKMRGITPKNPMLMLEYRVVPLIISTVKAGEDLSCSALTRGLGSPKKRTNMCDIGFHLWDWLIFGICVCCILIFCFQNQICSFLNL